MAQNSVSSSIARQAVSADFAYLAQHSVSSSYALSASWAPGGQFDSASWASSSISASYALTASHALTCDDLTGNIDGGSPYTIYGGILLHIDGGDV